MYINVGADNFVFKIEKKNMTYTLFQLFYVSANCHEAPTSLQHSINSPLFISRMPGKNNTFILVGLFEYAKLTLRDQPSVSISFPHIIKGCKYMYIPLCNIYVIYTSECVICMCVCVYVCV